MGNDSKSEKERIPEKAGLGISEEEILLTGLGLGLLKKSSH